MTEPTYPAAKLPAELAAAIEGKDSATAGTLLATHRTNLATHRTGLADLRSHLANERTHLAYLRTAISLIGFGITLNRFSVALEPKGTPEHPQTGLLLRDTENAGAGMVIVGLVLICWSLYRYWHVNQDIVQARFRPLERAVVTLTVLLIMLAGFTTLWLFLQQS